LDRRRLVNVCLLGLLALMPLLTHGCDWSYSATTTEEGFDGGVSATTGETVLSANFHLWFGDPQNAGHASAGIVGPVLWGYFLLGLVFALVRKAAVRGPVGFVMAPASAWLAMVSGCGLLSYVFGTESSLWLWLFFLSVVAWLVILLTHLFWFLARRGRSARAAA
ncbi:MAG: hypothetical protein V2A76_05575, partial [Planctomycetota bacterium]